jgi:MFS family permease
VFGSVFSATAIGVVGVTLFAATPAELGVVSAAASLPACLFGVLAGVLGDRLRHPRRGLILCDSIAGLAVLAVAIGIWRGLATIWWLAVLCFLLGCISALAETVYFTHLRGLVGPSDLTRARAKLQTGEYGATTASRAVAGVLIAALGGAMAFLVDAASYLASLLLLTSIRTPDHGTEPVATTTESAPSVLREAAEGFREAVRHPFLRAFSGFTVARSLVVGALATITAPFLLRTLGLPVGLYSLLFAATGLAGLAGSVLAGRLVDRMGLRRLAVLGSGGAVVTGVLLPLAGGPVLVTAGCTVLGLGLPVLFGAIANVGLSGAITECVPEEVLGRVVASLRTVSTGSQVIGSLAGGLLGSALGLRSAVWLCAALSLASGLLMLPAIRSDRTTAANTPEELAEAVG